MRYLICSECGYNCGSCDDNVMVMNKCVRCGSNKLREVLYLRDDIGLHENIKGKSGKMAGKRKSCSEFQAGEDWSKGKAEYVSKVRKIDRVNDEYYERVSDVQTGERIHECHEPLSQHFGHGSAKFKMEEIVKFLKDAETYYLATVEGDQPRVRPFGTAHVFEGKLYIQTGKKKNVSKQLHANPKAELCAFKGGEWIRVAGELIEDDRVEARQSMLDAYPELKKMYAVDDGNTEVFYFKNGVATISAFTHEPKIIKF